MSAVPYAPFPKFGPEVLGEIEYNAAFAKWSEYQRSLRGEDYDPPNPGGGADAEGLPEGHHKYTYNATFQRLNDGSEGKERKFREQGVVATSKDDAIRQGRAALLAQEGGGPEPTYKLMADRAGQPRGKPFDKGADERRKQEQEKAQPKATEGSGDDASGSESAESAEGEGDDDDTSDEASEGGGEGEGDGDAEDDDDTPKMPTCTECGQPRGSTEGCCAPEDQDMPTPESDNNPPDHTIMLMRTEGAPLTGLEASTRLQSEAHPEVIRVVEKTLAGVDVWTRTIVANEVTTAMTRIYGDMAKLANKRGMTRTQVRKLISLQLSKIPKAGPAKNEAPKDALTTGDIETIVALVVEKLDEPRRIVVSNGKKTVDIEGTPHHHFDAALHALGLGLNIMLVGASGTGKGVLARHIAEAKGLRFGFVACSEGMSEGMLLGRAIPLADHLAYMRSQFVDFYENGGVFLLDEVDAANSNVLLIVNEAINSDEMAVPNRVDEPVAHKHEDFHLIVAANTWGTGPNMQYVGRNRLDAAFLDRFAGGKFLLDYDARVERNIAKGYLGTVQAKVVLKEWWRIRGKLESLSIRRVWSTRGLNNACMAVAAGADIKTVLEQHTQDWTEDERRKAGIAGRPA